MRLRLHYSPLIPLLFVGVMGVYVLFREMRGSYGFVNTYTPETISNTFIIVIVLTLLLALLCLLLPCATVGEKSTTVYQLIPPFKHEFHYYSLDDLVLRGDELYYREGVEWKRIPIYRPVIYWGDWKALEKIVTHI